MPANKQRDLGQVVRGTCDCRVRGNTKRNLRPIPVEQRSRTHAQARGTKQDVTPHHTPTETRVQRPSPNGASAEDTRQGGPWYLQECLRRNYHESNVNAMSSTVAAAATPRTDHISPKSMYVDLEIIVSEARGRRLMPFAGTLTIVVGKHGFTREEHA